MNIFHTLRSSLLFLLFIALAQTGLAQQHHSTNFIRLSQDFLYAARTGQDTKAYIDTLANADEKELAAQINNDAKKKAFFINCYHAYTQAILRKNPTRYNNRSKFFKNHQIYMGDYFLSLDNIENGLLRHSKVKWNYGYIGKMLPSRLEKIFRISHVDYRIHFTLNCGAKSCPPIAYYTPENIEAELNLATKSYLHDEAVYDSVHNVLNLPAQMNWYRADFGGKGGELKICRELGIIPEGATPTIRYNKYNWSLYLDNNYKNVDKPNT